MTSATNETKAAVLKFEVASDELTGFHRYTNGLVSQFRGLVELKALADQQKAAIKSIHRPPLAERLDEYPIDEVESSNLVNFPPKLQPVPIRPLFLDLAWNYIDYPGRSPSAVNGTPMVPKPAAEEKKEPAQRRWFGFGR
jgi:signal recognition particle subunit SRP68